MIEVLIDPMINRTPSAVAGRGDVIIAKLKNSPWSDPEKKLGLVIQKIDAELEARLLAEKSADNPYPVISYPYAELDGAGRVLQRSLQRADIDAMPNKAQVMNPNMKTAVQAASAVSWIGGAA